MTQIPAPRVPFVDKETGLITREWYRYLLNVGNMITEEEVEEMIEEAIAAIE